MKKVLTIRQDEKRPVKVALTTADIYEEEPARGPKSNNTVSVIEGTTMTIKQKEKTPVRVLSHDVVRSEDIVNSLTSDATDKPLSAAQGKALKAGVDALSPTAMDGYVVKTSIVDDLTTGGSTNVLSAAQGVVLKGLADGLSTSVSGLEEDKADINGYYSTLTAGSAENLVGRGTVSAEFTRRASGGTADIGTGPATIKSIRGNTLVWNQLVQNGNFTNGTTGWTLMGGTGSVSDGILSYTYTAAPQYSYTCRLIQSANNVVGHKYLCKFSAKPSRALNMMFTFGDNSASQTLTANVWNNMAYILTDNTLNTQFAIWLDSGKAGAANDVTQIKNVILFDLTQMFGSGNEPSTVAEFEAMFPLPYYAYNAGTLLNNKITDIVTTGFNQWDEQWEAGGLSTSTGEANSDSTRIRSKNFCNCFPSTNYYLQIPYSWQLFWYDINKAFISYSSGTNGSSRTSPSNAYYFKIAPKVTTYNNDICINISWSGVRNGEYEAYETYTKALPVTTATSGGTAVFPDGMKSAGTAYDEMTATKAIKRIGVVDLGTLNWDYSNGIFYTVVYSYLPVVNSLTVPNILCEKYVTVNDSTQGNGGNMQVSLNNNPRVRVRDSNYTDAATFKTAMSGVYLYYELDTPTEYTLDTPMNLNYRVNDFGTEEFLPTNTSTPTTAPGIIEIKYAMNAVDTLRNLPKNYISKASMDHILTAMVSAGVIASYSLSWDSNHEYYTCSITAV